MMFIRFTLILVLLIFPLLTSADRLVIEPDDGYMPLLNTLNQAKQSIDLAIYGFTHKKIIQALVAAKARGVTIHILLEPTPYQNTDENLRVISELKAAGIAVQFLKDAKLLHEKILIIDRHEAWIMSMNFTYSTFTHERNLALIITESEKINLLEQLFSSDYSSIPIHINENFLLVSPDNSRHRFNELLAHAQHNVDVYAQQISDYQAIGLLAKIARQGVKVRIITALTENQRPPIMAKAENYLTRAGVEIRYQPELIMHAKMVNIDGHCAVIGSLNLTAPSFDNNREISALSCDPTLQPQLSAVFERDWSISKPMLKY